MIYHGATVLVVIKYIIVLSLSFDTDGSKRVRRGFCSTRSLGIRNGDYGLRSGNSVAKFMCNQGFHLYGSEQIVCFGSTWSNDPPMCISNTCQKIEATTTLRVSEEFSGSVLTFSCATMYKLEGSKKLICDGTYWSGQAPNCTSWQPTLACDFESSDLCGWSHNDKDDQDWRWNTGKTSTSRTGPSNDHTLGLRGNGHYMYFETSSPTRTGHKAMLLSPLYPAAYSRHTCFTFWYHILGVGDLGDLELFFKPESVDLSSLTHVIHVHEDSGDVWHEENIPVTLQTEPFQILIVATRGTSYRSDFAIDDVNLINCTGTLTPKNTTVTTRTVQTQPTIQTTPNVVNTTQMFTATQTAKPQRTTTVPPKTTKTVISTRVSTAKTTTPVTTVITQVHDSSTVTVFTATTTQKHTNSNIQTVTHKETTYYSKNTLKPVINPNVPVSRSNTAISGSKDVTSAGVYIIIGVGLFAAVASVVAAGMYCYRRQGTSRSSKECLSASNPVYRVMAGDEAAVQFAADDNEYSY